MPIMMMIRQILVAKMGKEKILCRHPQNDRRMADIWFGPTRKEAIKTDATLLYNTSKKGREETRQNDTVTVNPGLLYNSTLLDVIIHSFFRRILGRG
mmetsp:Transcript_8669/g.16160  ORF Transcript_8669/g.16160 Transcript_8669/m.16160 type:complete len:97 (+) Transcript_8669:134-424(+)